MLAIEMPDCIGLHELRVCIDLQSSFIKSVLKKTLAGLIFIVIIMPDRDPSISPNLWLGKLDAEI
jgi:hypothetical protein